MYPPGTPQCSRSVGMVGGGGGGRRRSSQGIGDDTPPTLEALRRQLQSTFRKVRRTFNSGSKKLNARTLEEHLRTRKTSSRVKQKGVYIPGATQLTVIMIHRPASYPIQFNKRKVVPAKVPAVRKSPPRLCSATWTDIPINPAAANGIEESNNLNIASANPTPPLCAWFKFNSFKYNHSPSAMNLGKQSQGKRLFVSHEDVLNHLSARSLLENGKSRCIIHFARYRGAPVHVFEIPVSGAESEFLKHASNDHCD
ncbi:hypothetical protein C8R44DRAFT_730187 [Mycena epipterygia]|nr:hypothetical protein C8R44DRAFT_730187 [Mycena epipterygia]